MAQMIGYSDERRAALGKALGTGGGSLAQYLHVRAGALRGDPAACSQWAAISLLDPGGASLTEHAAGAYQPGAIVKSAPRRKPKRKREPGRGLDRFLRQAGAPAAVRAELAKSAGSTRADPEFAAFMDQLGRSCAAAPRVYLGE